GGGTTRSDLEVMKRIRDLEGCPRTRWSKLSGGLKKCFEDAEDVPVWSGELEIPYFQGTFTTHARLKRLNRRLEYKFREVEWLAVMAMPGVLEPLAAALGSARTDALDYPSEELTSCWKRLLTSHFHDAITGASFRKANEELAEMQSDIAANLNREGVARRETVGGQLNTADGQRPYLCLNSLSWERESLVTLASRESGGRAALASRGGGSEPSLGQRIRTLDGEDREAFLVRAPSMGARVYYLEEAKRTPPSAFEWDGHTLTTPYYRVRFDAQGRIVSLVDRGDGRQYVRDGGAHNTFQMAEDATLVCDAWNLDSAHALKTEALSPEVTLETVSDGHLCFQLRSSFDFGAGSHLTQDMVFYAHRRNIDFVTRVDWRESHRWLKTAFPVTVRSTRVKAEIQYGHIDRDVNTNQEADRNRYEFCAHKWVAFEDGSHGIALLNDCKYGHDVCDSVLRLTLLRAPKLPDPTMDMGMHDFTYSLLPYATGTPLHETIRSAYDLNEPLSLSAVAPRKGGCETVSLFQIDNPNVLLEVVKKAEDSDQVVLRLYEASGGEQEAVLRSFLTIESAHETDMLECPKAEIARATNELRLNFHAFEIKTVQVALA
ncbi:MAG: glycoside hydrolase family 38 C-terminal domain-containing protein, partial [Kiritimatiellae bacterium]|nr:glycoside hydrolase family 38 C-terminal domain-containing protein [Kiritimatiellia bacterium]